MIVYFILGVAFLALFIANIIVGEFGFLISLCLLFLAGFFTYAGVGDKIVSAYNKKKDNIEFKKRSDWNNQFGAKYLGDSDIPDYIKKQLRDPLLDDSTLTKLLDECTKIKTEKYIPNDWNGTYIDFGCSNYSGRSDLSRMPFMFDYYIWRSAGQLLLFPNPNWAKNCDETRKIQIQIDNSMQWGLVVDRKVTTYMDEYNSYTNKFSNPGDTVRESQPRLYFTFVYLGKVLTIALEYSTSNITALNTLVPEKCTGVSYNITTKKKWIKWL